MTCCFVPVMVAFSAWGEGGIRISSALSCCTRLLSVRSNMAAWITAGKRADLAERSVVGSVVSHCCSCAFDG